MKATDWINVNERLPRENTVVLVAVQCTGVGYRTGYRSTDGFSVDKNGFYIHKPYEVEVLAWMPIPEYEPKTEKPFWQYDADTCFDTPNFCPGKYAVNEGKEEFMGYIYDKLIRVPEDSRYNYDYVLVNNGKVIAMGSEQWRCGGISSSCKDADFEERLKVSPCYDKVKHLPIATKEELEEPIYKYFQTEEEYYYYHLPQQGTTSIPKRRQSYNRYKKR